MWASLSVELACCRDDGRAEADTKFTSYSAGPLTAWQDACMRTVHIAAVAIAVVLLVGCQGPQADTPGSPSGGPPSPEASASGVQERETGLVQPKQVFGGDCTKLFTIGELSAAMGTSMTVIAPDQIFDNSGIVDEQNAALRCAWESTPYAVVDVLVYPSVAVTYDKPSECGQFTESAIDACPIETTVNGIAISGVEGIADGDAAVVSAAQATLLSLFADRATPENSAAVPIPAAGSWAYPVNCEAIVAAAVLSGVPGLGASSTGYTGAGGSDAYYPAAVVALWGPTGLPHCGIQGESVYLDFDAFGGGRWKEAELSAAPAVPLAVDGVDAVYVLPLSDGRFRINAFDGPNWLQFDVGFTENAGPIAAALVTSLDATAIP